MDGRKGVRKDRKDVGAQTSEVLKNHRDVGTQTCDGMFKKVKPSKFSVLVIAKKNKEHSTFPYYVIRCQKAMYMKSVRDLKRKYPEMTIVYEIRHKSNTMDLFNRIKENLGYIATKFNHLKVDDLERLKSDIAELASRMR